MSLVAIVEQRREIADAGQPELGIEPGATAGAFALFAQDGTVSIRRRERAQMKRLKYPATNDHCPGITS